MSIEIEGSIKKRFELTTTTESRASRASRSAQDTTPGHALSTVLLIPYTSLYPLTELKLERAYFSPPLASNNTDPSQP